MNDFKGYSERLDKTLQDKLFWLDRVNPDEINIIVDFGCGNGKLLAAARKDPRFADKIFVGIDSNTQFEPLFWQNMDVPRHGSNKVFYYTHPDAVNKYIKSDRVALIFSSVLHEAYSFNTLPFKWHEVKTKYVIIRDMCNPVYVPATSGFDKFTYTWHEKLKIFWKANKKRFFDHFSRRDITDEYAWTEFLMKHHYVENWETEKLENYFATNWYDIYTYLENSKYVKTFSDIYNIPYLVNKAQQDFGVTYNMPTHRSVIFYKPTIISKQTIDLYKDRFWFIRNQFERFGTKCMRCSEDLAYAYLWELCERVQEELTYPPTAETTERYNDLLTYMEQSQKWTDEDWIWLGQHYYNLSSKGVYYGSN